MSRTIPLVESANLLGGRLALPDVARPPVYTAQPVLLADTAGYWVRWQYEAGEWRQFDAWEWTAARRAWWLMLGLCLALFGVGGVISVLILPGGVLVGAGLAGAVAALGLGLAWLDYARSRRLHQALRAGPREIAIGPERVRVAGREFPLTDTAYVLQRVTLVPGVPAQILLRSVRRPRLGGNSSRVLRVPVPLGHHHGAAALMRQFQQQLIRPA